MAVVQLTKVAGNNFAAIWLMHSANDFTTCPILHDDVCHLREHNLSIRCSDLGFSGFCVRRD